MDWVINVELQFAVGKVVGKTEEDAREYAKQSLAELFDLGLIAHYHILSKPRKVIS